MASQQQALTNTTKKPNPLTPFREALVTAQAHFAQALPETVKKYLTAERLTKITLSAISRSPKLLECTPESVLRCVMDAASLGLEPMSPLQQAYLVPYRNKNGAMEAQFIVGYRGFIALARRSGEIESVTANVVHSRDSLKVNLSAGIIEHSPFMPEMPKDEIFFKMTPAEVDQLFNRGRIVAVYCVARFKGGGQHADFMTVGDVEAVRARSRSRDNGPWVTDYNEMARKTVVRRAAKYWPLSTELAAAIDAEDKAEAGELRTAQVVPDFQVFDGGELPESTSATSKVLGKLKGAEKVDDVTGEVTTGVDEDDAQAAATAALAEDIRKAEAAKAAQAEKVGLPPTEPPVGDGKTRDQREAEFKSKNAKGG